jgi:hypothetical protein
MADKKYVLRILALALVFGFLVAGCDNAVGTWKNVTDLNQIKGTWKASYTSTGVRNFNWGIANGAILNQFWGVLDYESVTYWQDVNGNGVVDSGEELEVFLLDDDGEPIPILYTLPITTEEAREGTVTFVATTATAGTVSLNGTKVTTTYRGDGLERDVGYDSYTTRIVRNGWDVIKRYKAGAFAAPYTTGYDVDDTAHTITQTYSNNLTNITLQNGYVRTPANIANNQSGSFVYISSDGNQIIYNGVLYTK